MGSGCVASSLANSRRVSVTLSDSSRHSPSVGESAQQKTEGRTETRCCWASPELRRLLLGLGATAPASMAMTKSLGPQLSLYKLKEEVVSVLQVLELLVANVCYCNW